MYIKRVCYVINNVCTKNLRTVMLKKATGPAEESVILGIHVSNYVEIMQFVVDVFEPLLGAI